MPASTTRPAGPARWRYEAGRRSAAGQRRTGARPLVARPRAAACAAAVALLLGPARGAAQAPDGPPPGPAARHEVALERSVPIPMRDGVHLSTDLYFPRDAAGPLPTVLLRTPYNKRSYRREGSAAHFFAGQGFVVAVQDKRGKFESEGEYTVSGGDAEDGYDTVDWLARQPWSNGRVGTYGCSYLGDVQIFQAPLRHPALAAQIPQAAGSSMGPVLNRYHFFGVRNGGAFELAAAVGWFLSAGSKVYYRPPAGLDRETFLRIQDLFDPAPRDPTRMPGSTITHRDLWWHLPTRDIMRRAGAAPSDFETVLTLEPADPWWRQFGYLTGAERFDVPALHVNSWYDFGVAETLLQFNLYRENAIGPRGRDNQFVIISPTAHCGSERATANTVVGGRAVGDARLDYWRIYTDWFDHWLKGIDNGITRRPRVQYYLMGRNEWRNAAAWPLPGTRFTRYYLRSDGRANSRFGTGLLSADPPGNEPPDVYVYDPAAPVPSVGGPICCTGTPDAPEGAFDQSDVQARMDVLVYTTPPLATGVEVTGPIEAVLYVSSSARDTDFTVKLVDVHPDGRAYNVQEGIMRARYRDGFDRSVWLEPGGIYEVRVDLQATANFFASGHRIRVEVSSSNFPRFDRNLNTGGRNHDEAEWVVAENRVYHTARYPSHIVLPVVPARR